MPIETDPVRREVVAVRSFELSGTLSPGTKPPRYGQSLAVPGRCEGGKWAMRDPLSRAARRPTQILQPRRMNIFTIRATYTVDPSTCMATKTITLDATFGPLANRSLFFITAGS